MSCMPAARRLEVIDARFVADLASVRGRGPLRCRANGFASTADQQRWVWGTPRQLTTMASKPTDSAPTTWATSPSPRPCLPAAAEAARSPGGQRDHSGASFFGRRPFDGP